MTTPPNEKESTAYVRDYNPAHQQTTESTPQVFRCVSCGFEDSKPLRDGVNNHWRKGYSPGISPTSQEAICYSPLGIVAADSESNSTRMRLVRNNGEKEMSERILTHCFKCRRHFSIEVIDPYFLHLIQCGTCNKPLSIESLAYTVNNQQKMIAALHAQLATARAEVRQLAHWISHRGRGLPDHACNDCVPGGEMVIPEFVCGFHRAVQILSDEEKRVPVFDNVVTPEHG